MTSSPSSTCMPETSIVYSVYTSISVHQLCAWPKPPTLFRNVFLFFVSTAHLNLLYTVYLLVTCCKPTGLFPACLLSLVTCNLQTSHGAPAQVPMSSDKLKRPFHNCFQAGIDVPSLRVGVICESTEAAWGARSRSASELARWVVTEAKKVRANRHCKTISLSSLSWLCFAGLMSVSTYQSGAEPVWHVRIVSVFCR